MSSQLGSNFSTSQEWDFFSYKLYIQDKHHPENDNTTGIIEYGALLGSILTYLGIAFKSTDEKGNSLYVNKESYKEYLSRFCAVEPNNKEEGMKTIQSIFDDRISSRNIIDISTLTDIILSDNVRIKKNNPR